MSNLDLNVEWINTDTAIVLATPVTCPLCGAHVTLDTYFVHLADAHPITYQLWLYFATPDTDFGNSVDIDGMSYDELLELCNQIGYHSVGLTESQKELATEPIAEVTVPRCTICLSSYDSNIGAEWVALRRCRHAFCKECIFEWLTERKTCPVCVQEVLPDAESNVVDV